MDMKHIYLTFALAFGALGLSAQSLDYLTFRTAGGTEQSLPIDGVKMVIADGRLQVSSPQANLEFALSELNCFFFAAEPTAIRTVSDGQPSVSIVGGTLRTDAPAGSRISVFTSDGRRVPTTGLSAGTYIVKINDRTFKTLAR